MTTAGDVGVSETKEAVTAALADYPNVKVSDPAGLTADAQAQVDQMLGIVTALLLLAVVVAILGIVNTLVLSVVERTRELGLDARGRRDAAAGALGGPAGVGAAVVARRGHRDRLGTGAGVALTRARRGGDQ